MKPLTTESALNESIEMWKWLAENPCSAKMSYLTTWDFVFFEGNVYCECYLCQYTREQNHKSERHKRESSLSRCSDFCPAWEEFCEYHDKDDLPSFIACEAVDVDATRSGGPYVRYCGSEYGSEDRTKYALEMVDLFKRAKVRHGLL